MTASGDGFDITFQHELRSVTWPFYGVGIFIIALRMYARIHRMGIRNLAPDDYLMLLAAAWYTLLIVCLNVIATGGGSNLFLPEELPTFTPEDIRERIKGSKIVIVSEQGMLNVIYTLKACMLFMYNRFTSGTNQQKVVKALAVYTAIGWFSTEIAFFTACRPFSGYWAVPPPNPQCTTLQHYAIVQACFNISSDLLMLALGFQLVRNLQLPLKQKIVLGVVFNLGIFIIVAAILTKVFNLSNVYDTSYMLWYTREASVAVYVANLPLIWPLLREWFPSLRSTTSHPSTNHFSAGPGGPRRTSTFGNPFSTRNDTKMSQLKSDSDSLAPVRDWEPLSSSIDIDLEKLGGQGTRAEPGSKGSDITALPRVVGFAATTPTRSVSASRSYEKSKTTDKEIGTTAWRDSVPGA